MVANDGFITYNHDALHETVQHMFNVNSQITERMTDLATQVKNNKEVFQGEASEQYGRAADKIGQDLYESTTRLHEVAGKVQDGTDELKAQDKSLAGLF